MLYSSYSIVGTVMPDYELYEVCSIQPEAKVSATHGTHCSHCHAVTEGEGVQVAGTGGSRYILQGSLVPSHVTSLTGSPVDLSRRL